MFLDIPTLAIISAIIFFTQFIALLFQYLNNKAFRGVGWWLLGSASMALGVILTPLVSIKSLAYFAIPANPLIILGHIFLYFGILNFFEKKEKPWILISIFTIFFLLYNIFIFVWNDISTRSFLIALTLAIVSFMTTAKLLFYKDRSLSSSATFTAIIFLLYGCFSVVRLFFLVTSPPVVVYDDLGAMLPISFIFPVVVSLLWTFGFIIMVNQRLNTENREEKEKLQLIFNTSPDAAIISRLEDGFILDVNAGFLAMTGFKRDEIIGNSTIKINFWVQLSDRTSFINELSEKGICENREFMFQRKDASRLYGSISAKIIYLQNKLHVISVVHDVTKTRQDEEAVRESEALYRSILNASPDDITITDMNGSILVISPAAKKMFGYEPDFEGFIGTTIFNYITSTDKERAVKNLQRMFNNDCTGPNEYHGVRKDKTIFDIEVNSALINNGNGQPNKIVFMVRDITQRKQTQKQIQQLILQLKKEKKAAQLNANTDSLTGLENRRCFDKALNKEFFRAKRSGSSLSMIMLDVDYFKYFNDRYGHLAGDECLKMISSSLKSFFVRATDIVARFGGEEFVVVLTDTDQENANASAERIRQEVERLAIPNSASDISPFVTVSLGVATVYPIILAHPEQLIALADEAMYASKKSGRNRVTVTTSHLVETEKH